MATLIKIETVDKLRQIVSDFVGKVKTFESFAVNLETFTDAANNEPTLRAAIQLHFYQGFLDFSFIRLQPLLDRLQVTYHNVYLFTQGKLDGNHEVIEIGFILDEEGEKIVENTPTN